MLEFYQKYYPDKFQLKAKKLSEELIAILNLEGILIEEAVDLGVDRQYEACLDIGLFSLLDNIYDTIRKNSAIDHPLLKKYLPELKVKPTGELLFADFFCGAGGLSQGFVNSGFLPVIVNDTYLDALETYYFNHFLSLEFFFNNDIKEFSSQIDSYVHLFENVKVIAGGPPCQGFSNANRQNFVIDYEKKTFIEDERNVLYKYFVQILGRIQPDFFVMENVKGMTRVEKQIEKDIDLATNNCYSFVPLVLDAQDFKIPQSRKRYFLIGCKNFMFVEIIYEYFKNNNPINTFTLNDALFGLPAISSNRYKLKSDFESDENGYFIRKIKTPVSKYMEIINDNEPVNYVFNHKSRFNNENDLEIFNLLPEGQNSLHPSISHLVKYKSRTHIFKDKYYKLKGDSVCRTITSHMRLDCHMYIHPDQSRGLSPREAARIQSFPDSYVFRGSMNSWYKQIGNAVPVKLAEIIAKQIANFYQ